MTNEDLIHLGLVVISGSKADKGGYSHNVYTCDTRSLVAWVGGNARMSKDVMKHHASFEFIGQTELSNEQVEAVREWIRQKLLVAINAF